MTDEELEKLEQQPTSMPDIGIDLFNFDIEEHANAVGQAVLSALQFFGKILNLSRLAQVIVAYDYDGALAALDRGTEVSGPLKATNTEIAVGVAMTPKVIRGGELRVVMVLNANHLSLWLAPENAEDEAMRESFFYTLAHECGHAHDSEVMATTLPGVMLKMRTGFRDGVLLGIALGCWEEYIACRLSAFMGADRTLRYYEVTFCNSVGRARERSNAAIRQYRMHADMGGLMDEVGREYKEVMVYASYLLGHIDGRGGSVEGAAPKAIEALRSYDYFEPFFTRLHAELRALHETYARWNGIEVFEPLKGLTDELLKSSGIDIQLRAGGTAYVNVPRAPETMPTLDEQVAFIASRAKTAPRQAGAEENKLSREC